MLIMWVCLVSLCVCESLNYFESAHAHMDSFSTTENAMCVCFDLVLLSRFTVLPYLSLFLLVLDLCFDTSA